MEGEACHQTYSVTSFKTVLKPPAALSKLQLLRTDRRSTRHMFEVNANTLTFAQHEAERARLYSTRLHSRIHLYTLEKRLRALQRPRPN